MSTDNTKSHFRRNLIITLSVLAVVLIGVASFYFLNKKTPPAPVAAKVTREKSIGPFSPLTGLEVNQETLARRPIAVMIENYWEARPQSGLDKADIVYEAEAEGGITRFLAIYQSQEAGEIGPVRSARPYFLLPALEYNPIYAHFGGIPQAQSDIRKYQMADVDGLVLDGTVFYRTSRPAPHNAYTSTERIRNYARSMGYENNINLKPFQFLKDGEENNGGNPANKVVINYPLSENTVNYQYDQAAGLYKRSHQTIHTDKVTGQQLTARNILIQFAPQKPESPGSKYLVVDLLGQGKAMLVTKGKIYTGTWSKTSERERTVFTGNDGNEFKLNPGQTWIQIVQNGTRIDVQ